MLQLMKMDSIPSDTTDVLHPGKVALFYVLQFFNLQNGDNGLSKFSKVF